VGVNVEIQPIGRGAINALNGLNFKVEVASVLKEASES
jgi:hypothetical protein